MKKLYLLLLALPALACFTNTLQPTATPTPTVKVATLAGSPLPTVQEPTCIVTAQSLNIRSNPGVNGSPVLGWLYQGDFVTILEDAPHGNWIRIQAGIVSGWINSKYCTRSNSP